MNEDRQIMQERLMQSLAKGLVNGSISADEALMPSLVYNDYAKGQKVLCTIEQELKHCFQFWFSVAFITQSGLQMLKPVLAELQERNIPGRILTTDYLYFSQPDALDFLDGFDNLEVRMYLCGDHEPDGFHTKGYFFARGEERTIIIGSSNLTDSALTTNREWNARISGLGEGDYIRQVEEAFEDLFHSPSSLPYHEAARRYRAGYEMARKQRAMALEQKHFSRKQYALQPNAMQIDFIRNLRRLLEEGAHKALLVSATGTGKTYASAFAIRELGMKRVLFLVHREQIARQALDSFRNVLGDHWPNGKPIRYGLLGGGHRDLESNLLFSTVQTLSRPDVLSQFPKDRFEGIIIDEVHRAAAKSYQKIFDWFDPRLWLGMSATPVRTDHESIYALFDYNVACSIGLRTALEEDLLCPFHYYALSDLNVDDETIADPSRFRWLLDEERIRHILDQSHYYGYSGSRLKGLIFAASIKEARALSDKLNEKGLRTLALSGEDSQSLREEAIERLVQDKRDERALDYLITVDIFNEGVDIPEVNQVILLRPTQSAIVFTQQLGRGLRKAQGKEYLVVLDFIGSYANNYLIPMAFTEAVDGNKDRLRRFVQEGSRTLPGSSTVYFDEISRSRIFHSIDAVTMNAAVRLREGWLELYDRLGREPMLVDFDAHQAMDPLLIFSNNNYRCYPDFLNRTFRKKNPIRLSEEQLDALRFISTQWANGKRPHELLALQAIAQDPRHWQQRWKELLKKEGTPLPEQTERNVLSQLERKWLRGTGASAFPRAVFLEEKDGKPVPAPAFLHMLEDPVFRTHFDDLTAFGLQRWRLRYRDLPKDGWFCRNEKYTYADTFRLMDLDEFRIPNSVGGYLYMDEINTLPVYINYDKAEDIAESTMYEDHFLSPSDLIAFSKSGRTIESKDIERLKSAKETGMQIPLFLRKNTNDNLKEFTYLGCMHPAGLYENVVMKDGKTKAVRIGYTLEHPVREDLYAYFTEGA